MANPGTQVSYGIHNLIADGIGKTVAQVRAAVGQPMNLPPDAYPVINCKRVDENHRLSEGEKVEFIKEAGVKG